MIDAWRSRKKYVILHSVWNKYQLETQKLR